MRQDTSNQPDGQPEVRDKANMEYQKVGRGGAGNYYSQQDIKNAEKRSSRDVESQGTVADVTPEDLEISRSEYAHSGRGGAGNYTDANTIKKTTAATTDVTPKLQESKPPDIGHYGRGGAGNYRSQSADATTQEDTKRKLGVQEKIHQQVVKDVESSLREPERAHLGGQKLV